MSAAARRVLALLLPVLVCLLTAAGPAAAQEPARERVVVVGVPGLRWDDLDPQTTPVLQRLAETGAIGALSVKAVPATSCPADGWLTLAAGNRARAFDVTCGGLEADRAEQRRLNLATRQRADVDALRAAVGCLDADGAGGELAGGRPGDRCPVRLVDGPPVGGPAADRAAAAAAADDVVADADAGRDPGSTLIVVGLSGVPGDDGAHLHLALAAGPDFPAAALRSASTRRAPYVQLVDVAPTVLELLDAPRPATMTGQPWQPAGGAPTHAELVDLDLRATTAHDAQVPFYVVLLGALLAALLLARARRSWGVVELAGLGAVAAVTGSFLAGLVPWWRTPAPLLVLLGLAAVAAVAGALTGRRLYGPLGPAGAMCGVLALVLVVDLLTGARLQIDTPAGYSPLVAGRFAGMGNVAFGVYAAAVLLTLAAATHRRRTPAALAVVAAGGLVAVVVAGAPPFGSDVGGVLALVPATALLAMLRTGARVSVLRLAAAGLAGAVLVAAFAVADRARDPADRTHLGRFVEQVLEGTAGVVLRRKAEAILDLLLTNVATALLPLVVAVAVLLVARPPRALRATFEAAPAWRHGVLAVGAASAVGFAVNDSGPAVPALALLVAGPATAAAVARRARAVLPHR